MTCKLIDAHAHLEEIEELDKVLMRAYAKGVCGVIAVSSDMDSCRSSLSLAEKWKKPKIFAALGIHPWELTLLSKSEIEDTIRFITQSIEKAVAIGEIGMDYWLKNAKKDENIRRRQKALFAKLLELAEKYEKPVIVHSRGAWKECFELVKQYSVNAVFHWFSGPLEVLREIIKHNYYISATLAVSYSKEHREAVKYSPISNLVLETDSPVYYRGIGNSEPALVLEVSKLVAKIKGISEYEVARKTFASTTKIFKIDEDNLT